MPENVAPPWPFKYTAVVANYQGWRDITPARWARDGRFRRETRCLPEQARGECQTYLETWRDYEELALKAKNLEHHLKAKGMAMQQAGIIPLHDDAEWLYAACETAIQVEGLFKGH